MPMLAVTKVCSPASADRLRQPLEDLLRHHRGVVGTRQVGEHDGEFVAADARHGVAAAHRGLQALRHLAKQRVARRMPEPCRLPA